MVSPEMLWGRGCSILANTRVVERTGRKDSFDGKVQLVLESGERQGMPGEVGED